jgi:predicted SnoaL-like aldol condensation-catalyzing enzyme
MKGAKHSAAVARRRFAAGTLSCRLPVAGLLYCVGFAAASAQTISPTGVPDLRGVWQPTQAYNLLKTREGKEPPLTLEARKVYEQNLAGRKKGDLAFDSMATLCQPPGIPRTLAVAPFRIMQDSYLGWVVFLSEWNKLRRPIPVGGKHAEEDQVYWLGDPVGAWDGKVLVVDSTQFSGKTLLDSALPHSESLQVTERIRLADRNTLEDTITLVDPETFTAPWTTVMRFKRLPSSRPFPIDVCTDRVVTPLTIDADVGAVKHEGEGTETSFKTSPTTAATENSRVAELEAKVAAQEAELALLKAAAAQTAASKKVSQEISTKVLGDPKVQESILHEDYIQHSPAFAKYGAKYGLKSKAVNLHLMPSIMKAMAAQVPKPDPNAPKPPQGSVQFVAEGDLVVSARTLYAQDPTEPPGTFYPYTSFVMMRIKDGKLIEHWDQSTIKAGDPLTELIMNTPPPAKK